MKPRLGLSLGGQSINTFYFKMQTNIYLTYINKNINKENTTLATNFIKNLQTSVIINLT